MSKVEFTKKILKHPTSTDITIKIAVPRQAPPKAYLRKHKGIGVAEKERKERGEEQKRINKRIKELYTKFKPKKIKPPPRVKKPKQPKKPKVEIKQPNTLYVVEGYTDAKNRTHSLYYEAPIEKKDSAAKELNIVMSDYEKWIAKLTKKPRKPRVKKQK